MRKSMKKLALSRETLHNMGLKDVQGGAIGTWNCTNRCTTGCSDPCPTGTGITGGDPGMPTAACSATCNPSYGCATDLC